ncbi:MAG: hydrogenase expression/formation protein HypE [Bacteroidales bacterium]|nr:hydrogenase expression/formation protein HypE [Bacteroidales bacterium]
MRKQEGNILLGHGSGGKMMHDLIESVFMEHFSNPVLRARTDAALLTINSSDIAFTTDSFVVDPLFFPGGDIGKLAVCGTVNDLAVTGAEPLYLSVSFIIEEGFPVNELEIIARSMALEAKKAGVLIVTGDTKVVNRGKCDKLFINSAGIGRISSKNLGISKAENIVRGDVIIINGTIGDHGIAVLNARESFNFRTTVESDCASLNHLISAVLGKSNPKFMRDPTRGGVAAVLNELAGKTGLGIEIDESALPVRNDVKAVCEILGFDPLHVANEGKVLIVASEHEATDILEVLRAHESGKDSAVIGKIVNDHPGRVVMKNETGGRRIVDTLSGDQLPRIC